MKYALIVPILFILSACSLQWVQSDINVMSLENNLYK